MEVKKLNSSPIAVAKHYEKKLVSLYSTIDQYLRGLGYMLTDKWYYCEL